MTTQLPRMEYIGEIDLDAVTLHDPLTGEHITTELIDHDNDEIDRRHGSIPGSKPLSGAGAHSPVLRMVVSASTQAQVKKAAAEEGMSVSQWLRSVVEEKLAT